MKRDIICLMIIFCAIYVASYLIYLALNAFRQHSDKGYTLTITNYEE
jgi:hypothetical protein